jgi:tyrosyl-tRNA synthetase
MGLVELIHEAEFASSKSQARRLIQQGAVLFNGKRVTDAEIRIDSGGVLQVGKRHFLRLC